MTFTRQRHDYFAAPAWVADLMAATRPEQLGLRTPCADFTVCDLMGHLLGTAHRGLGTARRVPTRRSAPYAAGLDVLPGLAAPARKVFILPERIPRQPR